MKASSTINNSANTLNSRNRMKIQPLESGFCLLKLHCWLLTWWVNKLKMIIQRNIRLERLLKVFLIWKASMIIVCWRKSHRLRVWNWKHYMPKIMMKKKPVVAAQTSPLEWFPSPTNKNCTNTSPTISPTSSSPRVNTSKTK